MECYLGKHVLRTMDPSLGRDPPEREFQRVLNAKVRTSVWPRMQRLLVHVVASALLVSVSIPESLDRIRLFRETLDGFPDELWGKRRVIKKINKKERPAEGRASLT